MTLEYSIQTKNALHITFDESGAQFFKEQLGLLIKKEVLRIDLDETKEYRGKKLNSLSFELVEEGEYVSFQEGNLYFEIEQEMAEEFVLFIENALKNGGFNTPEVISFLPKRANDASMTIYCFPVINN